MSAWWLLAPAMLLLSTGALAGGVVVYWLVKDRSDRTSTVASLETYRRRYEALEATAARSRSAQVFDQDLDGTAAKRRRASGATS